MPDRHRRIVTVTRDNLVWRYPDPAVAPGANAALPAGISTPPTVSGDMVHVAWATAA